MKHRLLKPVKWGIMLSIHADQKVTATPRKENYRELNSNLNRGVKGADSGFNFSDVYKRVCFTLVAINIFSRVFNAQKKESVCYVRIRNCHARTHNLSLLQFKIIADEDLNFYPPFRAESCRCFKSKNGLKDLYLCVGMSVCLSFGREREKDQR